MHLVFATKNQGKVKEVRELLAELGATVDTMDAVGTFDIEETGTTFEENAKIKSDTVMQAILQGAAAAAQARKEGLPVAPFYDTEPVFAVLSDDSGLEVDALDKAPGVYSARFMGEETSYEEKNAKILSLLQHTPEPKRTARFVSVISATLADGRHFMTRGTVEGIIGYECKGENGFGYDPIFYMPEKGKYMAEMTMEEKNAISHRGKALRAMKEVLRGLKE